MKTYIEFTSLSTTEGVVSDDRPTMLPGIDDLDAERFEAVVRTNGEWNARLRHICSMVTGVLS